MRKSFWMIPVVLLFTALGSTVARADTEACGSATCIFTGNNVTEIEDIMIGVTTYDVTFGTTEDMTFAGSDLNAIDANNQVADTLSIGGFETAGGACTVGVEGKTETELATTLPVGSFTPCITGIGTFFVSTDPSITDYSTQVELDAGAALFDEFNVAPTITPEPGTLSLALTGVGLLGLTLVVRKRKAPRLASV